MPGSVIWLDGVPLITTYVGPGILSALSPPHTPGGGTVQVSNPGPVFATGSGTIQFEAPPSNLILAPSPPKRGQPVCLYSEAPLAESEWTIFGTDQQIVAKLKDSGGLPCFRATAQLAPGIYLVRIRAREVSGTIRTVTRNLIIEP